MRIVETYQSALGELRKVQATNAGLITMLEGLIEQTRAGGQVPVPPPPPARVPPPPPMKRAEAMQAAAVGAPTPGAEPKLFAGVKPAPKTEITAPQAILDGAKVELDLMRRSELIDALKGLQIPDEEVRGKTVEQLRVLYKSTMEVVDASGSVAPVVAPKPRPAFPPAVKPKTTIAPIRLPKKKLA